MKIIRCKIMGEMDNNKCYDCFSNGLADETFHTRVMCKQQNVVEEITVNSPVNVAEPMLLMEQTA